MRTGLENWRGFEMTKIQDMTCKAPAGFLKLSNGQKHPEMLWEALGRPGKLQNGHAGLNPQS